MNSLTWHDLQFALMRSPKKLLTIMKRPEWAGHIFIAGGFIRAIVAGEPVNDVDLFTRDMGMALKLARELVRVQCFKPEETPTDEELDKRIYKTDNAYTLLSFKPVIQIIFRWVFPPGPVQTNQGTLQDGAFDVSNSFDFTCCCAVFWWGRLDNCETDSPWQWRSYCDERFYPDVAAKRLIYRAPVRNEDAGGSILRVLKYYQRGYRIPLDSLSAVLARMMKGVDIDKIQVNNLHGEKTLDEPQLSKVLCGLLREVDPNIDPSHVAHLPAESATKEEPNE